jgi:ABC-2 type transport system permease protein
MLGMTLTRIYAVIRKEVIQITRDPRTLAVSFLIPIMQLFLLGYAATNDVRNVSLVVLDQSKSRQSRALLDAFRATDYFMLAYEVDNERDVALLIDSGKAKTGLIIPPDYGDETARGQPAQVAFIIDGSDPTVASSALSAAILLGQSQSARLQIQQLSRQAIDGALTPMLEMQTRVWYNPDMVSAYFMIPGLIGMILQVMTTVLTSTAIVRERERGTMEHLIMTPVHSWELLVGKLLPYVLIAFGDTLEVLIVGTLWFKVPVRGDIGLLLGLSGLFLMTTLSVGLLISTIAHTQQEAMMLSFFLILPTIFLSGFFFSIAAMPQALQWVSMFVPLTYFLIIVRSIVLKGVGLSLLLNEITALIIFGIVMIAVASTRLRKRLD